MRLLKLSLILLTLGIVLFAAGLVAGVLAGGIPYPDGPNAGHTSAPGPLRVLENLSMPIALAGVSAGALGSLGSVLGLGVLFIRRRKAHSDNSKCEL
jgi:hypothetical protein